MFSPLPRILNIGGTDFQIKTDFRTILKIIEMLSDDGLSEAIKSQLLIEMISGKELLPYSAEGFEKMFEFIIGEKTENDEVSEQVFDFEQDEDLIFSSFMQVYNIDLYDIEYLHYHKFKKLLNNLGEDTPLGKIINLRSMDLSEIKDSKQKYKIQKLKNKYMIKQNDFESDEMLEYFNSL